MLKHTFRFQYQWIDRLIRQVKNDNSRDQQDEGQPLELCANQFKFSATWSHLII